MFPLDGSLLNNVAIVKQKDINFKINVFFLKKGEDKKTELSVLKD